MKKQTAGDDVAKAAISGIREHARSIGRPGISFTPQQLDEMAHAVGTLVNVIDLKRRLRAATQG